MSIRAKVIRKRSAKNAVLAKYDRKTKQIVELGANMVRNTAADSIHAHGSSGRTYEKYNPRRTHTASTENNPPNSDSGYLAGNIYVVLDADKFGSSVESRAEYSEALEHGTSTMRERPFLQPALEENRRKIIKLFARLRGAI